MKNKIIILAILSLALSISLYFVSPFIVMRHNERNLKDNILSLDSATNEATLNELTSFEWDKAYFFSPYFPKERIYEELGIRQYFIRETNNEGQMQVVFMKGNRIVCYCFGAFASNKYYFDVFYTYEDGVSYKGEYLVLEPNNKDIFKVVKEDDGYVRLRYIPQS